MHRRNSLLRKKEANIKKAKALLGVTAPRAEVEALLTEAGAEYPASGISYGGLMRRPEVTGDMIKRHMSALSFLSPSEAEELFTDVRYEGYLERQEKARAESVRLENMRIPEGTDYAGMHGLRREAAEKLERIRPTTIGQASRIPGVNPADVNVLIIKLKAKNAKS